MKFSLVVASSTLLFATASHAENVRAGVFYAGTPSPADSPRAAYENMMFDFAAAWANCDPTYMENAFSTDVVFAYPTSTTEGLDIMMNDVRLFCENAVDTSFFFPADAFYIDEHTGRVAVEVQFRTTQRGKKQVVNDVWIATMVDGKGTVLKEYLDGRVKDLQSLGVLQYGEDAKFLTPWQSRTQAWKECFPIVRAAPINECPG